GKPHLTITTSLDHLVDGKVDDDIIARKVQLQELTDALRMMNTDITPARGNGLIYQVFKFDKASLTTYDDLIPQILRVIKFFNISTISFYPEIISRLNISSNIKHFFAEYFCPTVKLLKPFAQKIKDDINIIGFNKAL